MSWTSTFVPYGVYRNALHPFLNLALFFHLLGKLPPKIQYGKNKFFAAAADFFRSPLHSSAVFLRSQKVKRLGGHPVAGSHIYYICAFDS